MMARLCCMGGMDATVQENRARRRWLAEWREPLPLRLLAHRWLHTCGPQSENRELAPELQLAEVRFVRDHRWGNKRARYSSGKKNNTNTLKAECCRSRHDAWRFSSKSQLLNKGLCSGILFVHMSNARDLFCSLRPRRCDAAFSFSPTINKSSHNMSQMRHRCQMADLDV